MAQRDVNAQLAMDACKEFSGRYAPRLLHEAWRWSWLRPVFDPEVLASETIARVYRRAGTFTCPSDLDVKGKEKHALAWTFTLLKNQIWTFCEVSRSMRADAKATSQSVRYRGRKERLEVKLKQPGLGRVILQKFLSCLSAEEARILLISYRYYNDDTGQFEIPPDRRVALCKELKMTEGALRVKRCRPIGKLKRFIHSHDNPPEKGTLLTRNSL